MADHFICDTPEVRLFIRQAKPIVQSFGSVPEKITELRPHFSQLISDVDWLPEEFRRYPIEGGMGRGIANWLLYRETGGSLSLSALVLSAGAATPVHDHLAWGLVGLYIGEQGEEVYQTSRAVAAGDHQADLTLIARNHLQAGSFYDLIPPSGDIHRVTTTSDAPSISLHLLTNDVGCVLRHRFNPDTGEVAPFRTGYSNQACED